MSIIILYIQATVGGIRPLLSPIRQIANVSLHGGSNLVVMIMWSIFNFMPVDAFILCIVYDIGESCNHPCAEE